MARQRTPVLLRDLKRDPVAKLMTRLAAEQRALGVTGRRVRILNVLGMRAQESPKRAMMVPFRNDQRASNATVRLVDEWLPVHAWTAKQVWHQGGQDLSMAQIIELAQASPSRVTVEDWAA